MVNFMMCELCLNKKIEQRRKNASIRQTLLTEKYSF